MPAKNLFYDFASVASTDNILNDEQYAADADRLQGNVPGIARQQLVNKALKQAAAIASSIGQVAAITMNDVIGDSEDGLENLVAFLENGFLPKISSSNAGKYLRVNAQGTDREWVPLPVASTTLAGIVSIGNQSFSGLKTFTGGIAGNLTGDVTGDVTGNLVGNASTATKLATARTISLSGVSATSASFDGSSNVTIKISGVPSTLLTGTIDTARLPVASASTAGIVSTEAQTFAGKKTFQGGIVADITGDITGDISGNAASATKLQTARTINGVAFDGTKNITVSDSTKLPIAGGTMTGTITSRAITPSANNTYALGTSSYKWSSVYATIFYGALSGNVTGNVSGSSTSCTGNAASATKLQTARTINGVAFDGTKNITVSDSTKLPIAGGTMTGTINAMNIVPKANNNYSLGSSSYKWSNIYATTFTGNLTGNVTGSSGSCTGNAASATKLQTARAINGVSFNGTANINFPIYTSEPTASQVAEGQVVFVVES